jgi:hypothetical protein
MKAFNSSRRQVKGGSSGHARGKTQRAAGRNRFLVESLENRVMLSVTLSGLPSWTEQGPGPILASGQGVQGEDAGAINAIAPDLFHAGTLFVATVNGGVWRTLNANDTSPTWKPLTDQFPSLSMGDVEISPLDNAGAIRTASTPLSQTVLFVGNVRSSSGYLDGGSEGEILKSTNGGDSWVELKQLAGMGILAIKPTTMMTPAGQVVLALTRPGFAIGGFGVDGLWRSTAGGSDGSWNLVSGSSGLPLGAVNDLQADPANPGRYYTTVAGGGIFVSNDFGASWSPINNPVSITASTTFALLIHNSSGNNILYAIRDDTGVQVFRSPDQGGTWTPLADPFPDGFPFGQTADPTNPNVIFIGGGQFGTNAIWRADFSKPAGSQLEKVTDAGANGTRPHADFRALAFDATNNLLNSDDGGIYRLRNTHDPSTRKWFSVNGNIRPTEFYSVAYDMLNGTIFGGCQDNGSPAQNGPGNFTWSDQTGNDGGVVAVDNISNPNHSLHYVDDNTFSAFTRQTFDNTNHHVDAAVKLIVNGTGGENLFQVESNNPGGSTIPGIPPFVLNSVDPTKMIIGTNSLYESTSALAGDSLNALGGVTNAGLPPGKFRPAVQVGQVNFGEALTPIAYGGMSGGVANPAVLWVGTGGQLRLRTSGNGLPALVANYPGSSVAGIVLDPMDWHTAFVLDSFGRVFKGVTDDAGSNVTWAPLSGNLASFTNDLRTIEFFRVGTNQELLVGGQGGVYKTVNPTSNNPVWKRYSLALPNAFVQQLHYVPPNPANPSRGDILLVGTFGRGALTINNASIALLNPDTAVEGSPQTFNIGSFSDVDGGPWSVDVNWGDGSPHTAFTVKTPGSLGEQTHTFGEEGAYTVIVTVADSAEGDSDAKRFHVDVSDPAVLPTAVPITPVEGESFTGTVATFTDPGGPEPLTDYSALINWGDGVSSAGTITFAAGTFTVSGTHTYAEESAADHPGSNPYNIKLTISHDVAPDAVVHSSATVSDPAVIAIGGFTVNAVEGTNSGTQVVATFTDPGGAEPLTDYSADINWGDGTPVSSGAISFAGGTFTIKGDHTYATGLGLPDDFGNTFCGGTPPSFNKRITVTVHHELAPDAVALSTAHIALPPASAHLAGGSLIVVGTVGDDRILVTPAGHTGAVVVRLNSKSLGRWTLGTGGRVIVAALAGDDKIQVAGGVRADAVLYGGPGNDRIKGGGGHNILVGCEGNNKLIGGNKTDLLIGSSGASLLIAGAGDDILVAGNVIDPITLAEDTQYSHLVSILGGAPFTAVGSGAIESLQGSAGSDTFYYHYAGTGTFDIVHGRTEKLVNIDEVEVGTDSRRVRDALPVSFKTVTSRSKNRKS